MPPHSIKTQSSVKDVIPELGGDFTVDEGIFKILPQGAKVSAASSYGISEWTRTVRLDVILPDGSQKLYFLKVSQRGLLKVMSGAQLMVVT